MKNTEEGDAEMEKKKLLIYAHYYIPDTASTGQILRELAEGMLDKFDITVICVVPSYLGTIEDKYKTQKYYEENINGVKVLRIRVPEFSKTNKKSRIKNIVSYFFGAIAATFKVGKMDYVFSISQPPILGGLLGVWGKWVKHAKYIYNIQDFNPEQVLAVGYSKSKLVTDVMMWFDKFSCKRSNLIITVGRDLVETVKHRFKGKKVPKTVMINNWIDEKEIYPLPGDHPGVQEFKKKYGLDGKFVIMYSGNIGLYYDLESLIKVLKYFRKGYTQKGVYEPGPKTTDGREVVFAFVGAGSVLDKLVAYVDKHHIENVVFIPYQDKRDLIYSLNAGDVHWCVNAKGIKGVSCPSKAYGIMAAGKAIIGVLERGTEVRGLIEECNCGKCCEPGDYDRVADIIRWFIKNTESGEDKRMGINGRKYLEENLSKDVSVKRYAREILKL
ncbi:MAG: glycosyltransferase family 4 protein [Lachnospiraceae bacterium]